MTEVGQVLKQLLKEAYEEGYCAGQNNPNGYSCDEDRDNCAESLRDQVEVQSARIAELDAQISKENKDA